MTTYGTPYLESEAVLAAQSGDLETVARIVGDLLPSERRELVAAFTLIENVISENAPTSCFPCPECQARPSQPCTYSDGQPSQFHHDRRIILAERMHRV